MSKEIKERIKKSLSTGEQTTLFGSTDDSTLLEACVDLLRYNGYRVTEPVNYQHKISNITDLVYLFYTLLDRSHPEYVNVYKNLARDRAIAKRMVVGRMEATGYSKELALKECAEIISIVFEYEDEFNFKYDINFGLFGQQKLGWITEKAINIMNKKFEVVSEKEADKKIEEIEQHAINDYDLEFNDVDSILARIEEEESKKNG